MMRRRSQLLTHDEITSYEPAAPTTTTSSCIDDEAPANNSSDRGWKDTIPEAIHQRRRRATMTTMTSPPLLLPTQSTTTTFTSSRGGGAGVGRSLPPTHHRRLTVRIILSIASVIILLLIMGDIFYFYTKYNISNDHTTADDIKELTQTVIRLSHELHHAQLDNERNRHKLEIVEKEISDNKIELTWEHEHVASMEESQRIMKDQFQKDRMNIIDTTNAASAIAFKQEKEHDVQLMAEHDENIQLRVALAKSIEELDRVRRKQKQQQQPQDSHPIELEVEAVYGSSNTELGARPSGSNVSNTKSSERFLRGGGDKSTYQPGDSIEIVQTIQHEDGIVKSALRPGIVTDINSDGTFHVVQLDSSSHVEKNVKKEGFRLYQVYNDGTPALYEQQPNKFVPITIVHYIHSSARPGLEIHGHYEFIYDADENREIHEGRAMMMYRYAEDGEVDT